jgi:hypothetical protein
MNEQLKEWNVLVRLLTEKVEIAAADVKLKFVQEFGAIKASQHEAAKKIKELENATGDAWTIAKQTADKGLHSFGAGLEKAILDFK